MSRYTLTFTEQPTPRERRLIDRGVIQIAGLVAAKVTARGLFINPGPTDSSWDFGLVDANEEFADSLTPKLAGFVKEGFPDATVTVTSEWDTDPS